MILISLKNSLQNAIKAADFLLVFNNIATANKLGMWEKRRSFTPPPPPPPPPPHPIEHIKMIHIPFLDIWLVLFSEQVTLGAIQVYMHQRVISPISDNDAELSRQFPFGIDLNKIFPDLLKLRTKTEKPKRQFSQHT